MKLYPLAFACLAGIAIVVASGIASCDRGAGIPSVSLASRPLPEPVPRPESQRPLRAFYPQPANQGPASMPVWRPLVCLSMPSPKCGDLPG